MVHKYFLTINNFLKTFITVDTILCVRLSGGLYYKISSNKVVSRITIIYCFACAYYLSLNVYRMLIEIETNPATFVFALIIYWSCFVVSLLTDSEYFQVFINDLKLIDSSLGVSSDLDVPVTRIVFIFNVVYVFSALIIFCVLTPGMCFAYGLFAWFLAYFILTITLTSFPRIMMFELLWYRMRAFGKEMEKTLTEVNRVENIDNLRMNLQNCIQNYQKLLEAVKKTNTPMKIMMMVTVVFSIPKIMVGLYEFIDGTEADYISRILEMSSDFLLACVPALLSELIAGELNTMKQHIVKQLLVCKDKAVRDVLDDCLAFFKHCPFKYTVWRLFSVDMNMIITMMNLCITYALAMIQFAHFYD